MSDQNPYPEQSRPPEPGSYPGQGTPPAWQQHPAGPPFPAYGDAEPSSEERTWALLAHIGTLVSAWFALGLIAPLITLLVKGDSAFVRRHSIESLNFQISLLIYGVVAAIVSFLLTLVTLGLALLVIIPAAAVIAIALLVFVILATMRASNGEDYRYPLTLRLVS